MNDNFAEYKDFMTEPREFLPYKKGEGLLQRCIERFIKLMIGDDHKDNKNMEAFCSIIKPQEEKLFNDKLFNMLFDSEYEYIDGLYADLTAFSESINKSTSYVSKVLMELYEIRIIITGEKGRSSSSIFTKTEIDNPVDYKTGERFEKEYYFIIQMNPLFLKACSEIRLEMDR